MEKINEILISVYLGNQISQILIFAGLIIVGIIFKRIFSKLSSRLLFRLFKKYSSDISVEKFIEYMRKPTALIILLSFIYLGFSQLNYPPSWNLGSHSEFGLKMFVERSYLIVVISTIIWAFLRIIDVFSCIMLHRASQSETTADNQIIPFMFEVFKIVFITIGVFVILGTVFNLNVGTLVAGLGIGGLAVALAAKETIENLLGSFTIFLDKPFSIGDLVKEGELTGTIEKIGFRSTRIRTLDQSLVTVPNKKMVDAELMNLSLRTMQRIRFDLKLRMNTSASKLKKVTIDIKNMLAEKEIINDDFTVKLYEFSDSSFNLLILLFIDTTDYNEMLNIKEEINYSILDILEQNNVELSYPSTRVFMESGK